MSKDGEKMNYQFKAGKESGHKFILLYEMDGNDRSLMEIARFIDPDSTLLTFKDTFREDGKNRAFGQNQLKQFDAAEFEEEGHELLSQIRMLSEKEEIPMKNWVLLGRSYGATVAAHLLLEKKTTLHQAILFEPMPVSESQETFLLEGTHIWFSKNHPDEDQSLVQQFRNRKATVVIEQSKKANKIAEEELLAAKKWLEKK
ncbi:carboxylesterase [Melissococcus plutonius]|nr:carboxylesterase [Melissococcus plutonius]